MISNINKCVHPNNLTIMFNYNDIKYTLNTIRSFKSLMFIVILSLRLPLNNVFQITNIK